MMHSWTEICGQIYSRVASSLGMREQLGKDFYTFFQ